MSEREEWGLLLAEPLRRRVEVVGDSPYGADVGRLVRAEAGQKADGQV